MIYVEVDESDWMKINRRYVRCEMGLRGSNICRSESGALHCSQRGMFLLNRLGQDARLNAGVVHTAQVDDHFLIPRSATTADY